MDFGSTDTSFYLISVLHHHIMLSWHTFLNFQKSRGEAQDEEVGEAESNPKTSRPAENLRDKAAKTTDKSQDSEEPA